MPSAEQPNRPRFGWLCRGPLDGPYSTYEVLDLEPGGEPGQIVVFSTCHTRQAAIMTCLALNAGGLQ